MVLMIVSIATAQSQVLVLGTQSMLDKLRLNKGIEGISDIYYSEILGDPFIAADFADGKVILKSGDLFDVELRYDIYADQMQFRTEGEIYIISNYRQIQSVILEDMEYIYTDYSISFGTDDPDGVAYFALLVDGECKLLERKNIRIQEPEPPKLYQEAKPAKFILKDDSYYLKLGEKSAVKIKSKKDLVEILSDQQDNLKTFIRSNKLSTGKREDLIKIISFYNEFSPLFPENSLHN